jgi:thymidylate synthase
MKPTKTATNAWLDLIAKIMASGQEHKPRNLPIREVIGNQVRFDMKHPIVLTKARNLNYKFMAAEAWWMLSGRNDTASIGEYCKAILKFSDDGKTFFGAYGPKIVSQIDYVISKLKQDPESRQAVINIWRENPPETKDTPCTISAQWLIRNDELHCIDTMRSNDAWLGFPYDVFNFSMLSWHIANELRKSGFNLLELGTFTLNAGSHHLYQPDCEKIYSFTPKDWSDHIDFKICAGDETWPILDQLEWVLGKTENLKDSKSSFFRKFKSDLIK